MLRISVGKYCMLINEILSENQTQRMAERQKQLMAAKKALYAGDLDSTLELMTRLSQLGYPQQGISAFFDRNEKRVKPLVMAMVKSNQDPVRIYNVTGSLVQSMRVDWPWLYAVRQAARQQLN